MSTFRWWPLLAVAPAAALASSLLPHTLEDRARDADRVALVQVTARRTIAEENDPRRIKTLTELVVGHDVKGTGPQRVTLVQLGGTWGPWTRHVPGDADFAVGETALVFLKCPKPDRCALVALGEGKLAVVGGEALVHDLFKGTWSRRNVDELVTQLRRATAAPPAKKEGAR